MKKIWIIAIATALVVITGSAALFAAGKADNADTTEQTTVETKNFQRGSEFRKGTKNLDAESSATANGSSGVEKGELETNELSERPMKQRPVCDGTNCTEENCFVDANGDGLCDNSDNAELCPCQRKAPRQKGKNAEQRRS